MSDTIFKYKVLPEKADLVIIPIPWAVKADDLYKESPEKILAATNKVELFHEFHGFQRSCLIGADAVSKNVIDWQDSLEKAFDVNDLLKGNSKELKSVVNLIQEDYKKATSFIEEKVEYWLSKDKLPVVLGGDGSVGLGAIRATSEVRASFGIFHFGDIPCLKENHNHLKCTEESVLFNAGTTIPEISRIISVGMGIIAQEELSTQKDSREKIIWFSNRKIAQYLLRGESFSKVATKIVNNLPEFVHLSFQASVLKRMTFEQVEFLLQTLVDSRRKIVSVDISGFKCESEDQAKLAAEVLYMISKTFGRSRGK